MNTLLTHPGTQYAPRLAAALQAQGVLYRYATGIAFPDTPNAWWWRMATRAGQEKLLLKRVIPGLPKGKLHLQPVKEALALLRHQKLGQGNDEVFFPRNKAFQEQLPQRLIEKADAVIGFDTSSWILAERCRKAGKPFVLDASIAHPLAKEKVYEKLRLQYPEWAKELAPKQPHLIEAELTEIEAADHIVVASAFTKKTYTDNGVPDNKITVNAYGTDLNRQIPNKQIPNSKREIPNSKGEIPNKQMPNSKGGQTCGLEFGISELTFLFFGSLSARKGFPLLCKVWETFHQRYPGCRLLAAGYDNRPPGFKVPEGIEVLGAIHPNDRTALFASADVFLFPSYFEGFAQVILEAMVCGLPVITTTATAGPDLFGTADCGRIIEPGNEAQLLHALEFFAQNPNLISGMSTAAIKAASAFTWQAYGERWVRVLRGVVDGVSFP
jgi:alpha-maltose-1-phosphate synthase